MSRENNQMAYISFISHKFPIKDADRIEKYVIANAWPVVGKRDEFQVGDLVVYLEISAFVPNSLCPWLTKEGHHPKEYNGVQGERLKSIKLRKQVSQGMILPMSVLPSVKDTEEDWKVGDEVGDILGIQKWEAPEEFVNANAKGNFPDYVPKSNQERAQNLVSELKDWQGLEFEKSEKLHGTSCTVIFCDGEYNVCSRNLMLKEDENTYHSTAARFNLKEKLTALGRNIAIQLEICGPKICSNQYELTSPTPFVYDVWDIDKKMFLSSSERIALIESLGLTHIPILDKCVKLFGALEDILKDAEGKSVINGSEREGVVYKCISDPSIHFKAVSNKWLCEKGE